MVVEIIIDQVDRAEVFEMAKKLHTRDLVVGGNDTKINNTTSCECAFANTEKGSNKTINIDNNCDTQYISSRQMALLLLSCLHIMEKCDVLLYFPSFSCTLKVLDVAR